MCRMGVLPVRTHHTPYHQTQPFIPPHMHVHLMTRIHVPPYTTHASMDRPSEPLARQPVSRDAATAWGTLDYFGLATSASASASPLCLFFSLCVFSGARVCTSRVACAHVRAFQISSAEILGSAAAALRRPLSPWHSWQLAGGGLFRTPLVVLRPLGPGAPRPRPAPRRGGAAGPGRPGERLAAALPCAARAHARGPRGPPAPAHWHWHWHCALWLGGGRSEVPPCCCQKYKRVVTKAQGATTRPPTHRPHAARFRPPASSIRPHVHVRHHISISSTCHLPPPICVLPATCALLLLVMPPHLQSAHTDAPALARSPRTHSRRLPSSRVATTTCSP